MTRYEKQVARYYKKGDKIILIEHPWWWTRDGDKEWICSKRRYDIPLGYQGKIIEDIKDISNQGYPIYLVKFTHGCWYISSDVMRGGFKMTRYEQQYRPPYYRECAPCWVCEVPHCKVKQ